MSYSLGAASVHDPKFAALLWGGVLMLLAMFGAWHLGMAIARRLDSAMRRDRRRRRRAEWLRTQPRNKS